MPNNTYNPITNLENWRKANPDWKQQISRAQTGVAKPRSAVTARKSFSGVKLHLTEVKNGRYQKGSSCVILAANLNMEILDLHKLLASYLQQLKTTKPRRVKSA